MAKIDVEVSSLACFIEADEAMASLAKVNAIAQGQCTVPLAFPAFNPANSKGAPNVLFGNACEHSMLICSPQLLAVLEPHLEHRFPADQVNAITAAMAECLGEGLLPRVIPVFRRLKRRILRV